MDPVDSYGDDNQSFHPSQWGERQQRVQFQDTGQRRDSIQVRVDIVIEKVPMYNHYSLSRMLVKVKWKTRSALV